MDFKRLIKKIVITGARSLIRPLWRFFKRSAYWVFLPFSRVVASEGASAARDLLNDFSPCPLGSSLADNQLVLPYACDLQIIVPAYNVEEYLRDCMDSILSQETQYTYQVILVDDGSTDSTGSIADEYAADPRVQVIHQANKGFSGARNAGLDHIVGEYIAFVDSDDKLMPSAIEALMHTARQYNAAIVEGGFYGLYGDTLSVLYKHKKAVSVTPLGRLQGFPWGKVFKSKLFENLHFPEQFWFEDSINALMIYPQIEAAQLIPDIVYVYRQNQGGISHTAPRKPKCVDTYWVTEQLLNEHEILGLPTGEDYFAEVMRQLIINAKRIRNMPEEIQQSVFILSRDLLEKHLKDSVVPKKYAHFYHLIQRNDFGAYNLYCKTH